jgi:hypothetical protein
MTLKPILGAVALLVAHAAAADSLPGRGAAPTATVQAATPAPASTPTVTIQMLPAPSDRFAAISPAIIALVSALSAVLLTALLESRREAKRSAAAAIQEQARRNHADAQDAARRAHEIAQDTARRAHEDQQDELRRNHEVAQEAARLATESRVRVHEQRLTAYVEFNAAVSDVFALAMVWMNRGGTLGTVSDAVMPALEKFNTTYQRASLLATPPVEAALSVVHAVALAVTMAHDLAAVTTAIAGRQVAVQGLDQAMRLELGVA